MTAIKKWLATLSVFALGGVSQSYIQSVEAKKVTLAEIERACERALRANTIEALEEFLRKYPPRKYRAQVACYALALDALNDFGRNNNDKDPTQRGRPEDGGGYRN